MNRLEMGLGLTRDGTSFTRACPPKAPYRNKRYKFAMTQRLAYLSQFPAQATELKGRRRRHNTLEQRIPMPSVGGHASEDDSVVARAAMHYSAAPAGDVDA